MLTIEINDQLNKIAQENFDIDSLSIHNPVGLHNVSMSQLRSALEDAFFAGKQHTQDALDIDNLEDFEQRDINVKSAYLIEAIKGNTVSFRGYPSLNFGVFNHDDLDEKNGEIRFYPVNNETGVASSRYETVISFLEIENGQLRSNGYFECKDINGIVIHMTSDVLIESAKQGNRMSNALSRTQCTNYDISM